MAGENGKNERHENLSFNFLLIEIYTRFKENDMIKPKFEGLRRRNQPYGDAPERNYGSQILAEACNLAGVTEAETYMAFTGKKFIIMKEESSLEVFTYF